MNVNKIYDDDINNYRNDKEQNLAGEGGGVENIT